MNALVESAFKIVDMGRLIVERKRSLPEQHSGLPERLKKDIRESFHILDTDNDGLLSRFQVERLVWKVDPDMTEEEMIDLLDTADLDGDSMYDVDEYLFLMYLKWNDQESVSDIKEAFRVFDKDSSGALSREEFTYILSRLGEPLDEQEITDILNYFDKDGSGEIDFDEFAYVMTGPHLDRDDGSPDDVGIPLTKLRDIESKHPLRTTIGNPASRGPSFRRPRGRSISRTPSDCRRPLLVPVEKRVASAPAKTVDVHRTASASSQQRPLSATRPTTAPRQASPVKITPSITSKEKLIKPEPRVRSPLTSSSSSQAAQDHFVLAPEEITPPIRRSQRHAEHYGYPIERGTTDRKSIRSMDSDNFSMCSDVLQHMHAQHQADMHGGNYHHGYDD